MTRYLMPRLAWALSRLPVQLLVAGVRSARVLPVAPGERPARMPSPAMIARGMSALDRAAGAGARRLDDPDGRWRELGNKVRAFVQFRRAAEQGSSDEVFAELWRREGEGYLLGREVAAAREGCREGSREGMAPGQARRDVLPRHTGFGLGLATHHFEGLRGRVSDARLRDAIDRFLADSHRLSQPGYEGAVVEGLGLMVQLSHPGLLLRVDEVLAARSARIQSLFWHGVGRGLYFDSREMAPAASGRWRAAERALSLPPDDQAQRNAIAGLAWATALVNFCEPEIIAGRLRDPLLWQAGDAAANGVASVSLLWLHAVGEDLLLRAFRDHWAGPGGKPEELWRSRLLAAVELAIDRVYPLLVERQRIDELFLYHPVHGWAESLGEDLVGDNLEGGADQRLEAPADG